MDWITIAPPDPVIMTQQIQTLIANVQELMKQNENLKRRVCLEGSNMSLAWCNRNYNDDKANNPRNSKRETSEHIE